MIFVIMRRNSFLESNIHRIVNLLPILLSTKFRYKYSTSKRKQIQPTKTPSQQVKWNFLEHNGPLFPPPYIRLPPDVNFIYNNEMIKLSDDAEEVAGFYGKLLLHNCTSNKIFNMNFFNDFRKVMTDKERDRIVNFDKCNFTQIHNYYLEQNHNKIKTKLEKIALKEEKQRIIEIYGYCTIDENREKISNFKIEPPGLFQGRGIHPKMGMLKKRIRADDVIINCSQDSKIPVAPKGQNWKEIRHDNEVTWLSCWKESINDKIKYISLSQSSFVKMNSDLNKYNTARKLHSVIKEIRKNYRHDLNSKNITAQQTAVALYFIDKLAIRTGYEKSEDEADTVGCCNLRVEHLKLENTHDNEYIIHFDFLGKDSIRYINQIKTEKDIYDCLATFLNNKKPSDQLFDRLTPYFLNKHLNKLLPGLTAKVFRTYNASSMLEKELNVNLEDEIIENKIIFYNRANRKVAILCNHQRTVPRTYQESSKKLESKINDVENTIHNLQILLDNYTEKLSIKAKKKLERLNKSLIKLKTQKTISSENKNITLGTSKLNYLDPRITVAWCKRNNVPLEKIYSKTQLEKFRWALENASSNYKFC